jgi:hypothetical protein
LQRYASRPAPVPPGNSCPAQTIYADIAKNDSDKGVRMAAVERLTDQAVLAKQRNGPTDKINLVYLKYWTKFEKKAADIGDKEAPPPEADEGF